jgi:molybdopterin/thiamine biosynthesis adenylyltransferase/rhodanese-related sulfurtransferase
MTREELLAGLAARIASLTPHQALALQASGAVLIDVREAEETARGTPAGALALGRGFLELRVEEAVPDKSRPVMTLCGSGVRSLLAAEALLRLGYAQVHSVEGGFARWQQEGLPVEQAPALDTAARERYARQLRLPEVGDAGQARLAKARVLLVGAGGLGSPAALYLAAAGVGTLGIVDDDRVERSNLQRQVLHTDARVGVPKVVSARMALEALNPTVTVVEHPVRLTPESADRLVVDYEVVIDGSDNFPTRYAVNAACVRAGVPDVVGAVQGFEGQVGVFWPARPPGSGPCYQCLFPQAPAGQDAPSCAEAGVLGVLPGVIGLLQATEAIKLLLGLGEPLCGRLLVFDALEGRFSELHFAAEAACPTCRAGA